MKEAKQQEYGESSAVDYIPGAEVLKTTEEKVEADMEQGWY